MLEYSAKDSRALLFTREASQADYRQKSFLALKWKRESHAVCLDYSNLPRSRKSEDDKDYRSSGRYG